MLERAKAWCWQCTSYRNEWFGFRAFIQRKGKCFFCRMDDLDAKYGPCLTAKLNVELSPKKEYRKVPLNRRELKKLVKMFHFKY